MIWTCWLHNPRDRYPVELTKEGDPGPRRTEQNVMANGDPRTDSFALHVGYRFRIDGLTPVDELTEARRQFNHYRREGMPAEQYLDPPTPGKKRWRHKGAPHYISRMARTMGVPDVIIGKAKKNPEIRNIDSNMGGLSQRYHENISARCGSLEPSDTDKKIAAAALTHMENTLVQSLILTAAAAQLGIDEAWQGWGMEPPIRAWQVMATPAPADVIVAATELPVSAPTIIADATPEPSPELAVEPTLTIGRPSQPQKHKAPGAK